MSSNLYDKQFNIIGSLGEFLSGWMQKILNFITIIGYLGLTVFILGLVCISSLLVYHNFWWPKYYEKDIKAIELRYTEFYSAIESENFLVAYEYMSPKYRDSHSFEKFRTEFQIVKDTDLSLDSKYSLEFYDERATLFPRRGKPGEPAPGSMFFLVKVKEQWYFEQYRYLVY